MTVFCISLIANSARSVNAFQCSRCFDRQIAQIKSHFSIAPVMPLPSKTGFHMWENNKS